jgi:hypothetical protein
LSPSLVAVANSGFAVMVGKAAATARVYGPPGVPDSAFGDNLGGMDAGSGRRAVVAAVVVTALLAGLVVVVAAG